MSNKSQFQLNNPSQQIPIDTERGEKDGWNRENQREDYGEIDNTIQIENRLSIDRKVSQKINQLELPIKKSLTVSESKGKKGVSAIKSIINFTHYKQDNVYVIEYANKEKNIKKFYKEIKQCFAIIEKDINTKVVLFNCKNIIPLSEEQETLLKLSQLFITCRVPVISILNGETNTFGILLGLCCDIQILSQDAYYEYDSIKLEKNLNKEQQIELLSKRFGKSTAIEWVHKGFQGKGNGLWLKGVQILPESEITGQIENLINSICDKDPKAIKLLKQHLCQDIQAVFKENQSEKTFPKQAFSLSSEPVYQSIENLLSGKYVPNKISPLSEYCLAKEVKIDNKILTLSHYTQEILLVKLCDIKSKNTFSPSFIDGIQKVFQHIKKNSTYKVVVLTGYDRYFACGGTKEMLLDIYEGKSKFTDTRIYDLALECPIPVIAAMQGHGIGAGWSMGMYCDFVVFNEESVYVSNYMHYGFTPGAGATLIFPYRFGIDLGREILFTAKEFKGSDLKDRGISYPVVPQNEVLSYAMDIAKQLSKASREQLIQVKKSFVQELRQKIEGIYQQEVRMHEQTFVGNKRVLKKIQEAFQKESDNIGKACVNKTPSSTQRKQSKMKGPQEISSHNQLPQIQKKLQLLLAKELQMEANKIELDTKFLELGLDSIISVTFIRKINEEYGLSINATKIYNYPTIQELAKYVLIEGQKIGLFIDQNDEKKHLQSKHESTKMQPLISIRKKQRYQKPFMVSTESEVSPKEKTTNESLSIAIIGVSGRFPKSQNITEYWNNIKNKVDCISEVPQQRWDSSMFFDKDPHARGKTYSKWMGALDDVDQFDPLFFNISPAEAQFMDPQQRLFLEQAWVCLEDAGYASGIIDGSRCGVFVGCSQGDYGQQKSTKMITAQSMLGENISILSSRISYLLNLQGPSLAIDTACSSSLVAIAEACNSLKL